jgi:predicted MFS family arabinose efflux permease
LPILVPQHLWERANAIDSNGYVVAQILGPLAAASVFAVAGGPVAMFAIAACFVISAVAIIGVADPLTSAPSTGSLLRDAWQGVVYTWRNPTLRGLGFAISTLNVMGGMTAIVIPLLVLNQLRLGEAAVGIPFALSGVAGIASALYFGRHDTRGREYRMLVLPTFGIAAGLVLLLPVGAASPAGTPGAIDATTGFVLLVGATLVWGFLSGPLDIALFTVRQRRTDPAWIGRAFAVSMAFNSTGGPIGAALVGVIATRSLVGAILLGIAAAVASGVLSATLVPRTDE